jgi:serine O-acetyltransferase
LFSIIRNIYNGLVEDVRIYRRQKDFLTILKTFKSSPGFRFVALRRIYIQLPEFFPLRWVIGRWLKRLEWKYGIQIPLQTSVGKGLRISHFGGIVVSYKAKLGDYVHIGQGVTIGQLIRGPKKGTPNIGNRVWISANSVIVGNIRIGNNVMIAPLTFVDFDIPDNAVVGGSPATILSYRGTDGYISLEGEPYED